MSKEDELRTESERILAENMPTETEQGFGAMHEMYLTLKSSGFKTFEALWIIAYVISGGSVPPSDRGSEDL